MFKTLALVVSVAAFLALRALVKFLLLPFRLVRLPFRAARGLRKGDPVST